MNLIGKRDRMDWTLLIFTIPIGIILILIVGQLAVRLMPFWSVNADMNSNLEPDPGNPRPFAALQPLMPQLLTPMAWAESYLTPGAEISYPEFVSFEPTASPSSTPVTPTATEPTPTTPPSPSPTATTPVPSPSPTQPPDDVCNDTGANNYGGSLPCEYPPPPPTTCQDNTATNYGQPLPCTYPPALCQDNTATNYGQPLPCTYEVVSTPPTGSSQVSPPPTELGVGTLPDNTNPGNYNNIGEISDGTYVVITLGIRVENTPDNNYDLAVYEWNNGGAVYLDYIIIGISHYSDGREYYEVFNWGENQDPDLNSNVKDYSTDVDGEVDDETVNLADLYDPDGAGPAPQTGILIDVDTADSNPPAGDYEYVVIISPVGGTGNEAQVDSVQAVEEQIP